MLLSEEPLRRGFADSADLPGDAGSTGFLSCGAQFFPDDSPENLLKRFLLMGDVFSKRVVQERLIVAAARRFDPGLEPLDNVLIQADGNSQFVAHRRR
jgi:hypothetical protein